MIRTPRWWLELFPYLALAVAISLSSWSFMRSEHYREETDMLLTQSYEIEWRGSQVRERLANIIGYLKIAIATGEREPRLVQEIGLLQFNIVALKNLEYANHFLDPKDFDRLDNSLTMIRANINPALADGGQDLNVLAWVSEIQEDMFHVSGTAGAHSRTLTETAQIEENALRNTAIFALALSAVIVVGVVIHQRAAFAQRKDRQIRSFSSLFAHMTRSRVSALALFIGRLGDTATPDPEMVAAAVRAAKELDAINDGLLKIAYAGKPARRVALKAILDAIRLDHGDRIHLDIPDEAQDAPVAFPQLHLILDELIRNAEHAVAAAGRAAPSVVLRGRLAPRFPFGRRLILEVVDNGVGMTPAVREKALEPFFSTRAGSHVGLGLTGCAEMVKTLGGRFAIQSMENIGTTVRISYPIARDAGMPA